MKTIRISDYVSHNQAVTADEGKPVYDIIIESLRIKEEIELDFSNITLLTTSFLNVAIGCLYKDYTSEILNKYIKFRNLSEEKLIRIKRVADNAKIFYSDKKQTFEENVNEAIYGSKGNPS